MSEKVVVLKSGNLFRIFFVPLHNYSFAFENKSDSSVPPS